MDHIEFRVQMEVLGVGDVATVIHHINGTSLIELARQVELVPATEQGEPQLAGAYAGLTIGLSISRQVDWVGWSRRSRILVR